MTTKFNFNIIFKNIEEEKSNFSEDFQTEIET